MTVEELIDELKQYRMDKPLYINIPGLDKHGFDVCAEGEITKVMEEGSNVVIIIFEKEE